MNGRVKRILSTPLVLFAVAIAMVTMQAAPASAQTAGVAVVQGAGTISPPLSVTGLPASHAYTFSSFNLLVTGVNHGSPAALQPWACSSSGGSISEVYAGGVGTGGWACNSGYAGSLVYVRVGAIVPVVITGGLSGALVCEFTPDQLPPSDISSYALNCAGVAAGL